MVKDSVRHEFQEIEEPVFVEFHERYWHRNCGYMSVIVDCVTSGDVPRRSDISTIIASLIKL